MRKWPEIKLIKWPEVNPIKYLEKETDSFTIPYHYLVPTKKKKKCNMD